MSGSSPKINFDKDFVPAQPARTGAILGAIDRRLARRKPALPASSTTAEPAALAPATTADEVDDFAKALAASPV